MPVTPTSPSLRRPPFWLALMVSAALVVLMAFIRLYLYPSNIVPLTHVLALLVSLWHRDRRLLYGMAGAFSLITLVKTFYVLPEEALHGLKHPEMAAAMQLANIWISTAVLHAVILARENLVLANDSLAVTNAELQASNEELAAREEEVTRQNEELQSQAEELEQQAEELRQQGEELTQKNEELARRERALQVLLDSARFFQEGVSEQLLSRICEATLIAFEGAAVAAAVVEPRGDQLTVRAHSGFGPKGPIKRSWNLDRAFATMAMRTGKTAYLPDLKLRPDLEIPQPAERRLPLSSILMSPLRVRGQVVGVLEVYSEQPREWSEQEFQVIEWLAAAISVVMEAAELQQELQRRQQEAEQANVHKTRFLAAVSHDVRTPANAISLLSELISQSANEPEMAAEIPGLVDDLRTTSRSMVELVTDVLDLARMDSAKPEVQETVFELLPLLEAEVRQHRPVAESRGLALSAESCQPVWVRTDRVKLARVLSNLVGNALKFTASGEVRIRCDRLPDDSVALEVIDTGIGISPEYLPHVFDEFFQLRNPERDRSKGTGLGLAICKRLTEAIGCGLSVESTPGRGSTFTVRIPVAKVVPAPSETTTESAAVIQVAPDRPLEGVHVLLVEDHLVTRQITSKLLRARGAVVTEVEDARSALNVLCYDGQHQVLLLDLMLPDMDGSEVLKYLQDHSPTALRCILAVSGDVSESRAAEVKKLGADGLVPKPVDMDRLTGVIQKFLRNRPEKCAEGL